MPSVCDAGEGFVYFGCPHCKEIISIKSEEKTSHCPKCNTDIIDYDSDAYRKLKGGKKLDLCPKCMKWELKKETPEGAVELRKREPITSELRKAILENPAAYGLRTPEEIQEVLQIGEPILKEGEAITKEEDRKGLGFALRTALGQEQLRTEEGVALSTFEVPSLFPGGKGKSIANAGKAVKAGNAAKNIKDAN